MSDSVINTDIQPFRGIRYDVSHAGALSSLLCPPYDIIDDQERLDLYARSPYNMIRLEHPLQPSGGSPDDESRYVSAALTFDEWMQAGILRLDSEPCFYVHDHEFVLHGKRHVRRGLVARVKLREWYDGVYPHELTGSKAKQDRLELMRKCHASFSGPLGLYEDKEGTIAGCLREGTVEAPVADVADGEDNHRFWAIHDPAVVAAIQSAFAGCSIYIADGHHRYETGLVYQAERRAAEMGQTVSASYDYILMTLTAFDDAGLFISPVCRVLDGMELPDAAEIEARLKQYFSVDYVPTWNALADDDGVGEMALMGVVGLRKGMIAELRKKPGVLLGAEVPGEHSKEYRSFNVSILDHVVMAKALGVDPNSEGVSYSPDMDEVVRRVQEGEAQLAFLLAPAHTLLVKKIADQNERMPRKSTYFYPKPPCGLVANPLD
ncbi:MAG: DUF1015 domain-containing protein [Dehalococcoidia bacterium]|nr:DUF1015 domain-containing protein [Dehalococcoidia bacterium]